MKFLTLSFFFFLLITSLAGENENDDFSDVEELEEVDFVEPEVTGMKNFSVERKDGKMHIGFDIVIKNPNKLSIIIKPSSLLLNIAEQKVGWVRVAEKIKIKKKSEAAYPFMLVGNSGDFVKSTFSGIWSMLTSSGVDFNVKGTVKAGVFFFKKKWKIDIIYKMTNEEFMSMF